MKKLIYAILVLLLSMAFVACDDSSTNSETSDSAITARLNNVDYVNCYNNIQFRVDTNHNQNDALELYMSGNNSKTPPDKWEIRFRLTNELPENAEDGSLERRYYISENKFNQILLTRHTAGVYDIAKKNETENNMLMDSTYIDILEYHPGKIVRGTFKGFLNRYKDNFYSGLDSLKDGLFILKY